MNKKFFLLFLSIFFVTVCFAYNPEIQREFVVLTSENTLDLNPHTASYSIEAQILNGLYEGLFTYNPLTLEPEPALCESYKLSRDKKTWTFFIRPDLKFSNGEKITAQTIKDSWIALLDLKEEAPYASLLDIISGVEEYRKTSTAIENLGINVIDEKTLTVRLISPAEHLPNILCGTPFAAVNKDLTVFSGPFVLSKNTESELVLTKNANYWDANKVALPSIKVIFSNNLEENTFQFNMGKIDWATDSVDVSKILNTNAMYLSTQFGTEYFFIKTINSPWNNPNMRAALLSAIPWEKLQEKSLVKAPTFIVPTLNYPEIVGVPEQDNNNSKKLIQESGLEQTEFTITCAIPDNEYALGLVSVLKEAWKEINVNLQIQKTSSTRYLRSISGWNADLFTYTWIGDFADPMAFLELFRGNSSLNESCWNDSYYNDLLSKASFESGANRLELLSQAEQYLIDQGLVIPISHPVSFNAIDLSVITGWYENALNMHPLKYLEFVEQEVKPNIVRLN